MDDKAVIHIERVAEGELIMEVTGETQGLILMVSAALRGSTDFREIVLQAVALNKIADEKGLHHNDLIQARRITEKEYNAS